MNPTDEELLSAYLDGEVTADEQARVERRLAEDAGYRQLHDELRALRQHLESLPMARLPADFSQTVLGAAERQMVAPRRAVANMEPAPTAWDSPDGKRWVRPLLWSGLIAAAGLMVMIFSPAERESTTAKLDGTDAPQTMTKAQPAVEAPGARTELSMEAAAKPSIHSDDALVASPAAPSVELGKQQENRALKMDQQHVGEGAVRRAKNAQTQLRSRDEEEGAADKRGAVGGRPFAGEAAPDTGNDQDQGQGAGRNQEPEALKEEERKFSEKPRSASPAPRLVEKDAARESQQFGFRGAPASTPPAGAAPAQVAPPAPSPIAAKTPGAGIAPPATTAAPREGGLAEQAAQGSARYAFDKTKAAPRGQGEDKLEQFEAARNEILPSLSFSVALIDQKGEQTEFENLLASAGPEKKSAGKPRNEPVEAPLQQSAVADAVNGAGPKRVNGTPSPQQVFEVELTHGALVDLLAQLRSRPAKYRLDPVTKPLDQEVKRRADELVLERKHQQAKGLALNGTLTQPESKLADGKSKELGEKDRAENTPDRSAEQSGLKGSVVPADQAAAPPAPQRYRVRIVLRRAAAGSEPAPAEQAPAPANTPSP